ncbi:MAG: indolepyruvate ferredoxin oxidoreductase subunit alpha [Candidatus Hodarchaeota archaeon]
MKINHEKCIGCEACHPYCTVGAIHSENKVSKDELISTIEESECIECGLCYRAQVCPTDAIYQEELKMPRAIRSVFSDPLTDHKATGVLGRGTQGMKTNDVTGRFRRGHAGLIIEMRRPELGARFRDVEPVIHPLTKTGIIFEPKNPLIFLMTDKKNERLRKDILNEKDLSTIIECDVPIDQLSEILSVVKAVASKINTVFS